MAGYLENADDAVTATRMAIMLQLERYVDRSTMEQSQKAFIHTLSY